MFPGSKCPTNTFVSGTEISMKQKFLGTKVLHVDFLLPGMKRLQNEKYIIP